MPRNSMLDDQVLVRYLLGLLPEEDTERIDEMSIVDDDVADRLRVVEDDLIDAYVSGTLDAATRQRFEAVYLASPTRREKVAFARRFLPAIDRAAPSTTPAHDAGERRARRPILSWPVLTAAAALLFLCGALLLQDVRLRRGLGDAQRNAIAARGRAEDLARQLDALRADRDRVAAAVQRAGTSLAIVLLPQTRSFASPPIVAVAAGADRIAFELRLDTNEFPRYNVALQSASGGATIWHGGAVPPASSASVARLLIAAPADVVTSGHFRFAVSGVDTAGHETPVATFPFQVDRH